MTDLRSDNTLGCSPEILEAIARAATDAASPYGNDPITARLRERCRELFETDLEIFPLITGTAGNAISIAATTPPWGAVFCHEDAHIYRDELGAPEFFGPGLKVVPVEGENGKLGPVEVERSIGEIGGTGRMAIPSCLSLTQATEAGTVYTPDELKAVCSVGRKAGLAIHMDGARFANAVAHLGCSAAETTWKAGVDLLVLGATKNGALGAEMIVSFRKDLSSELARRAHRSGHRPSKMRFISAQLDAYLADDLWLRNARNANEMAKRLASGLEDVGGVEILRPVEANVVMVRFAPAVAAKLRSGGVEFYEWQLFGEGAFRLVTGFDATAEEIDSVLSLLK